MAQLVYINKIIDTIQSFYMFSDLTGDDAEMIINIGAEILGISNSEMLRLVQES